MDAAAIPHLARLDVEKKANERADWRDRERSEATGDF
jgi:hypothetical protein